MTKHRHTPNAYINMTYEYTHIHIFYIFVIQTAWEVSTVVPVEIKLSLRSTKTITFNDIWQCCVIHANKISH